jgi:ABC-type amino acid transport substrate-binding protein
VKTILSGLTLALAMLALAAPAAQAGAGAKYADAVDRDTVGSSTFASGRYSDAVDRHPQSEAAPGETRKSFSRGYDGVELIRTEPRIVAALETEAAPGFDWRDAGIGAGGALAAMLVAAVAVLATRSRRIAHS